MGFEDDEDRRVVAKRAYKNTSDFVKVLRRSVGPKTSKAESKIHEKVVGAKKKTKRFLKPRKRKRGIIYNL